MTRLAIILFFLTIQIRAFSQDITFYNHNNSNGNIRAVWLTTIGGIDWPHSYAQSEASIRKQKNELTYILDKLQRAKINTVLLQTRVRGTVIYPSAIEPWDGCMSGKPGVSPGYDPLRFAIDECHKRGMELHAWVVTIPVGKWNGTGCRSLRKKYPSMIKKIDADGYMNPEISLTGDVIAGLCGEITRNYDVDGIHLDYIRYPENWNGKINRTQGRANITSIVRKIHNTVKSIRPNVKLSCSPIGKFDDLGRYSSRGWNAYNKGCQDAQGWLRDGLMDQLYPMMYFRDNQFFPFAYDWIENSHGKEIAAGLGIYFLDKKEGNWKLDDIVRQMNVARNIGMGICFFRTKFLLDNVQGIYDYLCGPYDDVPEITRMTSYKDQQCEQAPAVRGLYNNGNKMELPAKGNTLDSDYIIIESFTGVNTAVKPYKGRYADISDIPDGMYYIRSLNKKGATHRIGYTVIKRK